MRTYLNLVASIVFCTLKHPRFGDGTTVQFVNVDHTAKGDQPNHAVGWQGDNKLLNRTLKTGIKKVGSNLPSKR